MPKIFPTPDPMQKKQAPKDVRVSLGAYRNLQRLGKLGAFYDECSPIYHKAIRVADGQSVLLEENWGNWYECPLAKVGQIQAECLRWINDPATPYERAQGYRRLHGALGIAFPFWDEVHEDEVQVAAVGGMI